MERSTPGVERRTSSGLAVVVPQVDLSGRFAAVQRDAETVQQDEPVVVGPSCGQLLFAEAPTVPQCPHRGFVMLSALRWDCPQSQRRRGHNRKGNLGGAAAVAQQLFGRPCDVAQRFVAAVVMDPELDLLDQRLRQLAAQLAAQYRDDFLSAGVGRRDS